MGSIEQDIANMIELLESVKKDATAVDRGKKAPGVRIRKTMQEVKKRAQGIRQDVLLVVNQ